MKLAILAGVVFALLVSVAGANGGHKVTICHKGKTTSVDQHAVNAHKAHGDKLGACTSGGGGSNGGGDPAVTPGTFSQVNRILACADQPVIRVADHTMGIAVDLDLATFNSGLYTGVKFTVARLYEGIGATCDKLGGTFTGKTLNGYPVWTR